MAPAWMTGQARAAITDGRITAPVVASSASPLTSREARSSSRSSHRPTPRCPSGIPPGEQGMPVWHPDHVRAVGAVEPVGYDRGAAATDRNDVQLGRGLVPHRDRKALAIGAPGSRGCECSERHRPGLSTNGPDQGEVVSRTLRRDHGDEPAVRCGPPITEGRVRVGTTRARCSGDGWAAYGSATFITRMSAAADPLGALHRHSGRRRRWHTAGHPAQRGSSARRAGRRARSRRRSPGAGGRRPGGACRSTHRHRRCRSASKATEKVPSNWPGPGSRLSERVDLVAVGVDGHDAAVIVVGEPQPALAVERTPVEVADQVRVGLAAAADGPEQALR